MVEFRKGVFDISCNIKQYQRINKWWKGGQCVCKLENCHARVWMAYSCHIQIHYTRNNAQKTENITYFLPFISCALLDFACHWNDESVSVHCALLLPKMNLIIVFNGCFWSFSTYPRGSITTEILKYIEMYRKVMKKVST